MTTVTKLLCFSRLIFATTHPSAQDSVMTKTEISAVSSTPPSTFASVAPATAQ